MFDGPAGIIASLTALVTAIGVAIGVWLKWGHLWRHGTVNILEAHIARTQEQIDNKQAIIDELTEAVLACEIHEAELYGWMERQTDRLNWLTDQMRAKGLEPGEPLEMPPRRKRAKLGKTMASYIKNRTKYNTELSREVTDELLKNHTEDGVPKTY